MGELGESERRGTARAAAVTVALVVSIALVVLGMWKLPAVFVDEAALNRADGTRNGPAIQAAYNAARVPIGVVLASILAASAAAAGVVTTRKSIAVTQAGLDLSGRSLDEAETRHQLDLTESREKDERDRAQWREEQLSTRFQDAAKQLGDPAPAVRLAGVYAMARLADDWLDQRQVCVDVLCAYLRLPRPIDQAHATADEEVRQAVQQTLWQRTRSGANDGRTQSKWTKLNINLSGAILHNLRLDLADVDELDLNGAQLLGETHLSNGPTGRIDVRNVRFSGKARLVSLDLPYDRSAGIVVDDADVWWVMRDRAPQDPSPITLLAELTVKKGSFSIDVESYRDGGSLVLADLRIHEDGQVRVESRSLTDGRPFSGCVGIHDSEVDGQIVVEGDLGQSITNEIDSELEAKVVFGRGSPW